MSDDIDIDNPEQITEETVRRASEFVRGAIELFADHTKRMSKDLANFNSGRLKAEGEIKRAGRRTSGRIV
jgi:uncharacterized protein YecA (UPF0149 family)